MVIESYTITDTPYRDWEFRVRILEEDTFIENLADWADRYDPEQAETDEIRERIEKINKAWRNDEWSFVCLEVTPILVLSDGERLTFGDATDYLGMVEYGRLPSAGEGGKDLWIDRAALRESHISEMIDIAHATAEEQRKKIAAA